MSDMHNAPETIWLQVDPNGEDPTDWFLPEGATWCKDKINNSDVEYIRVDIAESLRQQLAECREERQWLLDDVAKFRGERNALRDYLAERDAVIKDFAQIERDMEQELAECQARMQRAAALNERDSTALDTLMKQAKREALLEAAESFDLWDWNQTCIKQLQKWAKELE